VIDMFQRPPRSPKVDDELRRQQELEQLERIQRWHARKKAGDERNQGNSKADSHACDRITGVIYANSSIQPRNFVATQFDRGGLKRAARRS